MAGSCKVMPPILSWDSISELRSRLRDELAEVPEEVRDELVIAGTELVENGLLHAEKEPEQRPVQLAVRRDDGMIELCVTSGLRSEARADSVLKRVREIEATPDKRAAYIDRLLMLAHAPRGSTSQLGLHRVALEGGCSLSAEHSGGVLTICARRTL